MPPTVAIVVGRLMAKLLRTAADPAELAAVLGERFPPSGASVLSLVPAGAERPSCTWTALRHEPPPGQAAAATVTGRALLCCRYCWPVSRGRFWPPHGRDPSPSAGPPDTRDLGSPEDPPGPPAVAHDAVGASRVVRTRPALGPSPGARRGLLADAMSHFKGWVGWAPSANPVEVTRLKGRPDHPHRAPARVASAASSSEFSVSEDSASHGGTC